MFTALTAAEFAVQFPCARGHEAAVSYIAAVDHDPKRRPVIPANMIPAGHIAVYVGHTNASRTKATTRFAVIAETQE